MPYTPATVFADSTTIVAGDIQTELEAIQEYVNGGMVAADVDDSSRWVTNPYVSPGYYNSINGVAELPTGGFVHKPYTGEPLIAHLSKYVARAVTDLSAKELNGTGLLIRMEEAGTVVVRYQYYPIMNDTQSEDCANDNTEAKVWMRRSSGGTRASTKAWFQEFEVFGDADDANGEKEAPGWEKARPGQGFDVWEISTPGDYNLRLLGNTDASHCAIVHINYVVQTYYNA